MTTPGYTDIRLVPMTAEVHAALMSEDALTIVKAVRFIVHSYEKSPPLTAAQAVAYNTDVEWWREELADL